MPKRKPIWFWEDLQQEEIGAQWIADGWEIGIPALIAFRMAVVRDYIRQNLFAELSDA